MEQRRNSISDSWALGKTASSPTAETKGLLRGLTIYKAILQSK